MIVCINCNSDTKLKMDELIAKDTYRDYSELIAVAVDNLWVIDREISRKGSLIIDDNQTAQAINPTTKLGARRKESGTLKIDSASVQTGKTDVAQKSQYSTKVPELFAYEGLESISPSLSDIVRENAIQERFTIDRWLFGQYNKLLPAKANCRALVRLANAQENGLTIEQVVSQIAEAAALLGDYLEELDNEFKTGRDDALSTAFPRSGSDAEKSRARYANQFVGSVNSQKTLSGLLSDYRLAGLAEKTGLRLLPTEQGGRFARMKNPILDHFQSEPSQKFCSEEVEFLLDHIHSYVPVEAFAFRTLLRAIVNGANNPDKLNESLHGLMPIDSSRSLSFSFIASQRSGALSRMADLGLISRERNGVKVIYTINQSGEQFMLKSDGNTIKWE